MTPEELTKKVRPEVIANKNFNKIFCVGYNKTGTTTIETILRLYGYSLPNQQEQEIRLTKRCLETEYTEFISFVSYYEAFQDMPFSMGQTYVVADALFPNSKFILTERDPESWFNSLTSFHRKIFKINNLSNFTEEDVINKLTYLYNGYTHSINEYNLTFFDGNRRKVNWDLIYDKDFNIALYEERNSQVKKYFANAPSKLLVVDITKEKNTSKICQFLNISLDYSFATPHMNPTNIIS